MQKRISQKKRFKKEQTGKKTYRGCFFFRYDEERENFQLHGEKVFESQAI